VEKIIAALEALEDEGSFCAQHTLSGSALRIDVKGFGAVKFPLAPSSVKSLIEVAQPARFGWRDQTLLDKKVRNAWEIPANRINIKHDRWKDVLQSALDDLSTDLGLGTISRKRSGLKAHLHNLLVYEPGQFFHPHQDTEKLPGMVATLVVVLPSPHEGGALIVDHQGEKQRIQGAHSGKTLKLIAFYADCHHEIKPVRKGFRVALTYNLTLSSTKDSSDPVSAAFPVAQLTATLREHFAPSSKEGKPKKWVYLLDHQYTQQSLGWNRLKNGDRLRAKALIKVAQALNLDICLALADIQETWDAESEDDDWYSRRHRYSDWNDGEEDAEADDEDFGKDANYELRELIDDSIELNHWIDARGKPVRRRDEFVCSSELCWTTATHDFNPFKSEYEGYMGNYGNTLERWYHRAAIVLSPRKKTAGRGKAKRRLR
jgi:2OG-Fe(II) oxygenase superfamily